MSDGHVLVLGGARSGKTGFAERLAMRNGRKPVYLATATVLDGEMEDRVRTHQAQRKGRFRTVEEPIDLSGAIVRVAEAVEELAVTLGDINSTRVILVSNEVGLGIVPDNPLARNFRDLAGSTHQRLADICDDVYFVVAGLPWTLKGDPPQDGEPRNGGVHEA
jgi:adenosylcobinamide kinase/adenosylcobinamide-phosphate guanylyltransferase